MENENTPHVVRIPASVPVVGVLFVIGGVVAVIEILVSLGNGLISLNFGVVGIFIGTGILQLNNGWRRAAVIVLALGIVLLIALAVLFVCMNGEPVLRLFGQPKGTVPKSGILLLIASTGTVLLWESWVLTRHRVRHAFMCSRDQGVRFEWSPPWLTALIIIAIHGVFVAEAVHLWSRSEEIRIWTCDHFLQYGGAQEEWRGMTQWHSSQMAGDDDLGQESCEIIAIASMENEELARFHCKMDTAVHPHHGLVFYRLSDRSPKKNPKYAIRSRVHFGSHWGDLELGLVTTQYDSSPHLVAAPNPNSFQTGAIFGVAYPCPTLRTQLHFSRASAYGSDNRATVCPECLEVTAGRVADRPAPRGMFPGSTQPIDWVLEVISSADAAPTQRFEIPHDTNESDSNVSF